MPGQSTDRVIVKFAEGVVIRLQEGELVAPESDIDFTELRELLIRNGITTGMIERLFTRPAADLEAERRRAQRQGGRALADLNLYYTIHTPDAVDIGLFCDALNKLPIVELATPVPQPPPLPVDIPPTTPDFSSSQGYLDSAPGGIGATDAASPFPGADGTGTRVVDIEYQWVLDHEDLELPSSANIDSATLADPFPSDQGNHGTAVLGELVGGDNEYGVTGIVPGATMLVAPANTFEFGYNVGRAVSLASSVLGPGDAILIEQQTGVCGGTCGSSQVGCGPVEHFSPWRDAIEVATALGIVVIEAAGNGRVDLDDPDCFGVFDRSIRDSHAIIVGAGSSDTHARLSFSSYGSRVDLQGWGHRVATTGYGALFNPGDIRQRYTSSFSGTSSASPIVTGAALVIQSARLAAGLSPLKPLALRQLLVDTGTPQAPEDEHIGPLPDLAEALPLALDCAFFAVGDRVAAAGVGRTGLSVETSSCGSHDPGDNRFDSDVGTLIGGPEVCDGRTQWRIQWDRDGLVGWSTENWLVYASFESCTGCPLDVDESGTVEAATDVVYIARHLLGLTPVPSSFRALDPNIPPDDDIASKVDALSVSLDVDANGVVGVATDMVYVARHLLGLSPVPPSFRDLDPSIPSDEEIAARIDVLCPEVL